MSGRGRAEPVPTETQINAACHRDDRYVQALARAKRSAIVPLEPATARTITRSGGWYGVGKIYPYRQPAYWEVWLQPSTNGVQVRARPMHRPGGAASAPGHPAGRAGIRSPRCRSGAAVSTSAPRSA